MKEMLLTVRGALQQDIVSFMCSTKKEVNEVCSRMEYVEHKIAEFTLAFNELVDAYFDIEDELKAMRLKMADTEDRSLKNNVKFRGIPKSVKPADLCSYLQKLMTTALLTVGPADIIIDRAAHRPPKPSYLPETSLEM